MLALDTILRRTNQMLIMSTDKKLSDLEVSMEDGLCYLYLSPHHLGANLEEAKELLTERLIGEYSQHANNTNIHRINLGNNLHEIKRHINYRDDLFVGKKYIPEVEMGGGGFQSDWHVFYWKEGVVYSDRFLIKKTNTLLVFNPKTTDLPIGSLFHFRTSHFNNHIIKTHDGDINGKDMFAHTVMSSALFNVSILLDRFKWYNAKWNKIYINIYINPGIF